jgi:hypothetical protein
VFDINFAPIGVLYGGWVFVFWACSLPPLDHAEDTKQPRRCRWGNHMWNTTYIRGVSWYVGLFQAYLEQVWTVWRWRFDGFNGNIMWSSRSPMTPLPQSRNESQQALAHIQHRTHVLIIPSPSFHAACLCDFLNVHLIRFTWLCPETWATQHPIGLKRSKSKSF